MDGGTIILLLGAGLIAWDWLSNQQPGSGIVGDYSGLQFPDAADVHVSNPQAQSMTPEREAEIQRRKDKEAALRAPGAVPGPAISSAGINVNHAATLARAALKDAMVAKQAPAPTPISFNPSKMAAKDTAAAITARAQASADARASSLKDRISFTAGEGSGRQYVFTNGMVETLDPRTGHLRDASGYAPANASLLQNIGPTGSTKGQRYSVTTDSGKSFVWDSSKVFGGLSGTAPSGIITGLKVLQ